ncbi:M15 family metallopeptidase [Pseudomarimonas salicorniae]|uniref:D-alanyl-D-alanine carboxypeptidase family protein n=1 Tax=Pseudomarimonas salicorniae TaxID=2933270 RepID=A0ABT0GHX8_9GAMM|nr:M15 family metallopeptidase [Lysobacter sp. CAU 1642]MCK7594157.1 D-alanyl-D-alanine carboxypeptidase family protein [Lysobacter sp. CAU 1642]
MQADWLYNADEVDALPADRLRARSNTDARQLARAQLLLRRKRDGRFIATLERGTAGYLLRPIGAGCSGLARGIGQLLACLGLRPRGPIQSHRLTRLAHLPRQHTALPPLEPSVVRLLRDLAGLGIDALAYAEQTGLPLMAEPPRLRFAGTDRYGRPLWLLAGCGQAWQRLRAAARDEGVQLEAISGFRGYDYQRGIIERKLRRGQGIEQILAVNAAPGFSEHHTGRALDIGTPGEPAAEESFEHTPAFAWLCQRAADFEFRLSYPRDNPHGIVYEPWHWFWTGEGA